MKIGRLGSGASDYASFVQHVGIPAVDMPFGGGKSQNQPLTPTLDELNIMVSRI